MNTPFWIDHEYDRANASDGKSRFGAYLRQNPNAIDLDDRARFASDVWRIANTPVMTPGYVRWHPRILEARAAFNAWDGSLTGFVTVVIGWPSALQGAREWRAGASWFDWPIEYRGGEGDRYYAPGERDLTRGSYLTCSGEMAFPIPMEDLPEPPFAARDLFSVAQATVAVLVEELNEIVAPVITVLEARS